MSQSTPSPLDVLALLQTHRRLTAAEIAARLGLDSETVRHYIATLLELGIPIKSGRGEDSAYLLHPSTQLTPLMFSDDEATAVAVALIAAQQLTLGELKPALEAALAKVERLLPLHLRDRVEHAAEANHLGKDDVYTAASEKVAIFNIATMLHRQLFVRYHTPDGEPTERTIDPYGLVHHQGNWYSVGYCHLRQDMRVFRLDRVLDTNMRPTTFEPPADFDALDFVIASLASAPRS